MLSAGQDPDLSAQVEGNSSSTYLHATRQAETVLPQLGIVLPSRFSASPPAPLQRRDSVCQAMLDPRSHEPANIDQAAMQGQVDECEC